jgi:hypothetical protein
MHTPRAVLLTSLAACLLAVGPDASAGRLGNLVFTTPPPVIENRLYVPARQFCDWIGASVIWRREARSVTIAWRGLDHTWAADEGRLVLRSGRAFIPIRDFAEVFGGSLTYDTDQRAVHYWGPERDVYAAIRVGWRPPRQPAGLSPEEADAWRFFAHALDGPRSAPGSLWEPREVRVSQRWASAKLHPLNLITDDCLAIAEKQNGSWRLLASGTDVGTDGNTYGIPAHIRRDLDLYF